MVCNLRPGYSVLLRELEGDRIEVSFFDTQEEQLRLLRKWLARLRVTFEPSEIVVLSPKEDAKSCAGRLAEVERKWLLRPARKPTNEKGQIRFGSIHAFKGLESPAVVLTDLDQLRTEIAQRLFYVGMTRARHQLVMLLQQECRQDYMQALAGSFLGSEGGGDHG